MCKVRWTDWSKSVRNASKKHGVLQLRLWFKSLWHWDPYAAAADPVEKLPLPLQGETDEWSSGLEVSCLRCLLSGQ